jgi:GT2 family glycosyltransferase
MHIAALLTCHNRRDNTLACLESLASQELPTNASLQVTLVDDGSQDGTSEAVTKRFPGTRILHGDGNLYWCGGMRMAWNAAALADPDYYLLINDDTHLDPDAIKSLLELTGQPHDRIIAVAAIRDPITGIQTYGGIQGMGSLIATEAIPTSCETFNANAVLVPRAVFAEIGTFHSAYTHGMGDYDYGYMAGRHGMSILQSSRTLGTCKLNPPGGNWHDATLSRRQRLRLLQGPKGLPFREWVTYNRRNSGWRWPIRSIAPYVRILLGL